MATVLTVIAGIVLAAAATVGVVVSQTGGPTGTPDAKINLVNSTSEQPGAVYDQGQ